MLPPQKLDCPPLTCRIKATMWGNSETLATEPPMILMSRSKSKNVRGVGVGNASHDATNTTSRMVINTFSMAWSQQCLHVITFFISKTQKTRKSTWREKFSVLSAPDRTKELISHRSLLFNLYQRACKNRLRQQQKSLPKDSGDPKSEDVNVQCWCMIDVAEKWFHLARRLWNSVSAWSRDKIDQKC